MTGRAAGLFLFLTMPVYAAHTVTIEDRPSLQSTLMPSTEFSGGGMQLVVKVKVLDESGNPANGVRVRVSAQSGASLARLRGYGITSDGIGTVIAAWDIPTVSLTQVVITACTDEPSPDCSKTEVFDLRRRWDLETETSYTESVGNQVYSTPGVPAEASDVLSDGYQFQALARLVFNLHSGGTLAHTNQWSGFAEGGGYFLHSTSFAGGAVALPGGYGPYYFLQSFENDGAHPVVAFGLQDLVWGRLFTGASVSLPFSNEPGDLHAQAAWEQPLGRQLAPIGGLTIDQPEFGKHTDVFGSAWGPLFGFAYFPKSSAAVSFTALGDWASVGKSQFASSSGNVSSITAATSPGVRVSFNYHRGGPAYLSAFFSAQNLTTDSKSFFVGTTVTLRDLAHRMPK